MWIILLQKVTPFFRQSNKKNQSEKKSNKEGLCMGKALSPSALPLACPKSHHKKLDKKRGKIDKNETSSE